MRVWQNIKGKLGKVLSSERMDRKEVTEEYQYQNLYNLLRLCIQSIQRNISFF